MYTNADCTIFYPVYNNQTRLDEWESVQVKGVFWENCKAASMNARGMTEADWVTVYIPFTADFSGKTYKRPKEFKKAPDGAFTIAPEGKIVKGLVSYNGSIAKLAEEFDDVFTITSVDTMDYGNANMQHWQIGGR